MEQQVGNRPQPAPGLIWGALFIGYFAMLGVLFYLFGNVVKIEPLPEVLPYLFYGGLGTALLLLVVGRGLHGQSRLEREGRQGVNPMARLFVSVALAELPGMVGAIHHLFGGELNHGLLLAGTSLLLFLLARP